MTVELQSSPDVVRQVMKHMEVLDYDEGLKLVAADCEYTNPPPLGSVQGLEVRGGQIVFSRDYFGAATILSRWPSA